MPNITTYADNELYIKFLHLPDEKRFKLRKDFIKLIQEAVTHGNNERVLPKY